MQNNTLDSFCFCIQHTWRTDSWSLDQALSSGWWCCTWSRCRRSAISCGAAAPDLYLPGSSVDQQGKSHWLLDFLPLWLQFMTGPIVVFNTLRSSEDWKWFMVMDGWKYNLNNHGSSVCCYCRTEEQDVSFLQKRQKKGSSTNPWLDIPTSFVGANHDMLCLTLQLDTTHSTHPTKQEIEL